MARLDATSELIRYDEDLHAWTLEQVRLLEAGRLADLDIVHLVDELKELADMPKSEIATRLVVLLQHLLKWQFQPEKRSNSWRATILEQRFRINEDLSRSPSLRRYPAEVLDKGYRIARLRASDETGLPLDRFPKSCPYSAGEALDEQFWPGAPDLSGE
jgi:hypothetical protein